MGRSDFTFYSKARRTLAKRLLELKELSGVFAGASKKFRQSMRVQPFYF